MATIVQPPFWVPRPADTPVWVGGPKNSAVLSQLLTAQGQVKPRLSWNFGIDNPPVWQFLGQINRSLVNSLAIVNPFVNPPWKFGQDDSSIWVGTPQRSAVLANLLTAQGQVGPRLPWNFTLDDPPPWLGKPTSNQQLLPFLGSAFPRKLWAFDQFDDAAFWQGKPSPSAILADLLTAIGQVKPRVPWNFGLNEPPSWYGQSLPLGERNLVLLTTQIGTPIFNQPFAFGIDYSSFWMGGPTSAYTLYIPPPPPFSLGGDWLVLARRRFRR